MIFEVNRICSKLQQATPLTMLLPRELREEFDGIIARIFPTEVELALEGLEPPDPDSLGAWLERLAES
jgi:hypothetical protein